MDLPRPTVFLATRARKLAALAVPFLLFGLLLLAVEAILYRVYYSKTYRFYDVAEVYEEDASTTLLYRTDRDLFWRPKSNISLHLEEDPLQYPLFALEPITVPYRFTIETDSWGYRSPEFTCAKRDGTQRVVALGDSRTMGEGVEAPALYPQRLQALLEQAAHPAEVINAGVFGYSSEQGLTQLEHEFAPCAPDLVTVLFGINDQDRWEGITDVEKAALFDSPLVSLGATLDRSMIVYFVRRQALRVRGWLVGKTPVGPHVDAQGRLGPARVSPERYERNLTAMVDLARQRGFRLLFLIVPTTPYAYFPSLYEDDLRRLAPESLALFATARTRFAEADWAGAKSALEPLLDAHPRLSRAYFLLGRCYQHLGSFERAHEAFLRADAEIIFKRYENVVRRVAAAHGVELIDLTPEFHAIGTESPFIDDMHPNPRGHEMIARALYRTIAGATPASASGAGATAGVRP